MASCSSAVGRSGPVNTAEDIFADPHVRARGLLMDIEDPAVGTYAFVRSPIFLSEAPDLPTGAPPALGQHTQDVLKDLGYESGKIEALVAQDVVSLV